MPYLAAAVILVGIVAVLDLLLTVGLVKRLREHTELLAPLLTFDGEAGRRAIRPAGARPDAFEATTVDGTAVTLASLSLPAIVGFFAVDCKPCQHWMPRFIDAAHSLPQGRSQALAVVASLDGAASDEIEKLREVANVVMEAPNGPVAQAFSVTAWPALCRVDENGVISTTDHDSVVGSWVSG